ncbi:MAG: hypothetical protein IPL60_10705 [Ardenticatenia bacterium]|nr:hypothetical protein [Ardenticatenia bacterium]
MHANLRAEPSASAPRRWAFLPPRRALGRLRERLPDLAAAAIGLLLALPILLPERLPLPRLRGADTESVLRTLELTLALRAGHWPPRWMPDALFGLGYPFWNFHGPLPYVGAALVGLGQAGLTAIQEGLPEALRQGVQTSALGQANLVAGTRVTLALWLILAALGASRLLRRHRPRRSAGLLAALLLPAAFLVAAALEGPGSAPSRLGQAALFPWVLAAALTAVRSPGLGASLRWGGLLALLIACEPRPERPWLSGAVLILSLAALLWQRRQATGTAPPGPPPGPPTDLPTPSLDLPAPWAGPGRLRRWLADQELRRWPRRPGAGQAALMSVTGGMALGLALSAWLWLPAFVERPHLDRVLPDQVLGGGAQAPTNEGPARADMTVYESLTGRLATLTAAPLPAAVHQRPAGGLATALGHQGNPRTLSGITQLEGVTPGLRDPARRDWRLIISGNQRGTLAFPILWFPGWEARVNGGRPRETSAVEGSGWLKLTLEPGECASDCSIVLRLGRSPVRAAAEILSLLALLLWLSLWLVDRRRGLLRGALTGLAVLAVAALVAWLLPRPDPAEPALFAWLPQTGAALPLSLPAGLTWEGGEARPRLIDAVMSSPASRGEPPAARAARRDTLPLDAGDTLELRLRWRQAPPDLRVKAQLVMAAAPLLHWRDSAVEAEAAVDDDGGALVNLNVPATTIPGLYLLRLSTTVGEKPLRTAAAGAEGEVYLGPIRVRRLPERLPATEGNLAQLGDLTLVAITAEDRIAATASGDDPQDAAADKTTGTPDASAGWLPVRITWKAARPLALDHSRTLRLLDPAGTVLAELQGMPFGGVFPTSAWPAGEPVSERVWLRLPPKARLDADRYRLEVELLDGLSGASLGSAQIQDLVLTP